MLPLFNVAAPTESYTPETLRRATAAAVRSLAGTNRVAVALPAPDGDESVPVLRALSEGAAIVRRELA